MAETKKTQPKRLRRTRKYNIKQGLKDTQRGLWTVFNWQWVRASSELTIK